MSGGAVVAALEPLIGMLSADGYDLEVDSGADRTRLRIAARADACAECLVPRTVLEPMIANMLSGAGLGALGWQLEYPPGSD
jgi:hypothetical protein